MKRSYKALLLLCMLFMSHMNVYGQESTTDNSDDTSNSDSDTNTDNNDGEAPAEQTTTDEPQKPEIIDGFTAEQRELLEKESEAYEFQAEVGRLMDILINSLYTHKEVFLRELISNAADALDKIRFLSVSNPEVLAGEPELSIRIEYDNVAKTLSVTDTGIGMTKQDLINNLGTIAKSGTTAFVQHLAKGGNLNLIGQFGVGFYSAYLAGNKVSVTSKHNDDDQYVWESSAASTFHLIKDPRGNTLKRGTRVTLHLKQDAYEFCEESRIKTLVKKYSEFINFPIYLQVEKEVSKEVPIEDEPEETTTNEDQTEQKDDLEVKDATEEDKKPKTKTIREKVKDWELINDTKALWLRPKEEITDDEYKQFYKSFTKDFSDPLNWIHFTAEGEVEFRSILYVPQQAPQDLYENYFGKSNSLKLYVRRVLINEQFEDLMPKYLNFIKGVVDSDDLPLNVNRESLQQLKMLKVMSRKLVRKALEMIQKLSEYSEDDEDEEDEDEEEEEANNEIENDERQQKKQQQREQKKLEAEKKFNDFWKAFGKNIKLGIIEDAANRAKLAKLVRFYTSGNITKLSSFDDYISRMKEGQDSIYYLAGESKDTLIKSPVIQGLLKREFEVLLLEDPIDEFSLQHLQEYEKKKLVNVAKGDFKLPEDDVEKKKLKKLKKLYQPLTDWWKTQISDLDSVTVTQKLVNDPCIIVATEYGYSANMERIQKAQAYSSDTNKFQSSKKILQINPNHPAIKELLERVKEGADSDTAEHAKLLYEAALLNSGYSLTNPGDFASRFYKLINEALGVPKDASVSEVELDLTEDDEDEQKDKNPTENTEDLDELQTTNSDSDSQDTQDNQDTDDSQEQSNTETKEDL